MRPVRHLLAFLFLAPTLLVAQDDQPQRPFAGRQSTIGGGLEMNIPIGDFNEVWGRNFWGFGANFTRPGRLLPFDYGFDFGYARMGTREAKVFAEQAGASDPVEGELTVKCKLFSYMATVRLRPINGRISPYVEGLIGARQFTTRSDMVLVGTSEPITQDRKANAWTGSYGWAAGTLGGFGPQFYVDGRVERLWGGIVSYVDPTSITISNAGEVSYGTLSSATDVINVQVGVGLRF